MQFKAFLPLTVMFFITSIPTALAASCESGGTHNVGGDCHGKTNNQACQTSNHAVVVSTPIHHLSFGPLLDVFSKLIYRSLTVADGHF